MVTITVADKNGAAVKDATVTGSWSNGASGTASCTTDTNGKCTLSKGGIAKKVSSVTFTVEGVSHATKSYDSTANVETSVIVAKP